MNPGATQCTGTERSDVVAAGCSPCLVPSNCTAGQYLGAECAGTETKINECRACVEQTCPVGEYSGGCGGLQPARCLALTRCPAGQFLDQWSKVRNGVCKACTNCAAQRLVQVRACGLLEDAACEGELCGETMPCNSTSAGARFCNYVAGVPQASCGVCPEGYSSDGQTCQECPEGKTCTRLGGVACAGQCGPGVLPRCDPVWGYVRCDYDQCQVNYDEDDGKIVVRGSYVFAGADDCAPYFRCDVGWYKRFSVNSSADCSPCLNKPAGFTRYVTGGVAVNDMASCLWECDASMVGVAWDFGGKVCVKAVGASNTVPEHPAGSYGVRGGWRTCPQRHTTRENTALVVGDCLACPAMPEGAEEVVGSRNCEWECGEGWRRSGSRCLRTMMVACTGEGMVMLENGWCVPSAVPWNRPGTRKKSWAPVRVEAERLKANAGSASVSGSGGTRVLSVGGVGDSTSTILAGYGAGGVTGRYWVEVEGGARIGVEGPVCSAVRMGLGGHDYLVCAVCNESFLAFVNLSAPVDSVEGPASANARRRRRSLLQALSVTASGSQATTMRGGLPALQVLIGQASHAGWRDGFKTQARFGVELYIAKGEGPVVWVLDRWNCVVREVVIGSRGPGDYLTRVYTVHGLTERFLLTPPSPKCYGPGSLAGPRRFWEVGGPWGSGLLFFTDDTGLWQLESKSGELARVLDESWGVGTVWAGFEADNVVSVRQTLVSVVVTSPSYHPLSGRICTTSADCQYFECMKLPGEATCSRFLDRAFLNCRSDGLICPQGYCPVGSIPQFYFGEMICNQCPPGKYVATSSATSCTSGLYELVTLVFRDGTEWDIVADTEPCGGDYTSRAGGDCVIGCAWQDGRHYVDPVSGACVACVALQCGVGQQMVKCTRSAPARCEACPVRGSGKAYVVAGRCDEDLMRYLPPCPRGFYLSGQYCEACADPLKTTFFAGATRVEQCKCKRGLRWSKALGKCVGRDLYAYEDGACVREGEACLVPNNTVVVDAGRCIWECAVGFFQVTDSYSGWLEKCHVCNRDTIEAGLNASTRGDNDSPWSCEFRL